MRRAFQQIEGKLVLLRLVLLEAVAGDAELGVLGEHHLLAVVEAEHDQALRAGDDVVAGIDALALRDRRSARERGTRTRLTGERLDDRSGMRVPHQRERDERDPEQLLRVFSNHLIPPLFD